HNHGLKVIGHLGATGWKDAMEAGVDELCHGLDAFPEAGLKARLVNGRAAYEGLDQLDLKEPRYAAILQAASLMRERAKAIGGQLEVRSERGTGTEVDLT